MSVAFTGPGSISVRVTGELDAVGVPVFEAELERVWSCGARRVTVDLSEVTFLGLAGLHCLLGARSTAQELRTRLSVTVRNGHMYRLLVLAGAGDVTRPQASPPGRRDEAVRTGASGGHPSGSTTDPAGQPDMAGIAAVGNS